jgi:hypothetical protein
MRYRWITNVLSLPSIYNRLSTNPFVTLTRRRTPLTKIDFSNSAQPPLSMKPCITMLTSRGPNSATKIHSRDDTHLFPRLTHCLETSSSTAGARSPCVDVSSAAPRRV